MTVDLLVVSLAWCFSYWIRFSSNLVPTDKGIPPFSNYLSLLLFIWLIWAFVFRRMGLYRPMRGVRRRKELLLLLNANAVALVIFISATYLFREKSVPFSRLVFLYFGIFATFGTILQRSVLRSILRSIRTRGYNLRYVLVIGTGNLASNIVRRIRRHRELGLQVIGCLSKDGTENGRAKGLTVVGSYNDLGRLLKERDIDQVVVALPLEDNHLLKEIMTQVGDSLVDVKIVPDVYEFIQLGSAIEEFDGLPVITLASTPMGGVGLVVKRAVDLILAAVFIVLFSPLMLLIAVLVKLTSRGPMLYRQERVSIDGSKFNIYKFRTMRIDAEDGGPQWATKGDSRVTLLGKFLRRSNLDELPQLFNVLRGDMSIVGPRPERPVFIQQFRDRVPLYMLRHKVPAGMTGWAQVNGWRGNTSIEKRIEHDLYYIENWSLLLDFKILFLTLVHGFRDRNAY